MLEMDLWPTPTAQNASRDWNKEESLSLRQLSAQLSGHQVQRSAYGTESYLVRLNADFLDWLMGFPRNWSDPTTHTEFEPWVTQLAPLLQQWLSPCSEEESGY